jgi:hypothetical protein
MKHLGSPRGYQAYFESWAPDQTGEAEALVENLRDLFVEQTLDARIEAALPTLAKIQQQGNNMKEAEIFENWINNLSEGTWALPETPEQQEKLNRLMSAELIVGPDATNATEQLYDVVGDDELFDILNDLADKSQGRANCWDDSDVQRRLAELGIQTPQSTQAEPADVAQDTAPPVKEGDNMATFVEDRELAEMLKYAGVPVKEGVLTDSTGSTLEHIKDTFKRDVKDFVQSGEMSDNLYDALYDYYFDDMPYGTKKARDGDPHEWVSDRFAQDIGLDEGWKGALAGGLAGAGLGSMVPGLGTLAGGIAGAYAGHKIGDQGISDPDKEWKSPEPKKSVSESSCNMTAEGEYCPEHGLVECGGMYEDGGAVGMPYSMGEAQAPQDPINSNSAMTGSYYEGKETDIQEGDALLARIKSLALLR